MNFLIMVSIRQFVKIILANLLGHLLATILHGKVILTVNGLTLSVLGLLDVKVIEII